MAMDQPADRNLALELVRVTEAAAMAAAKWQGRDDKIAVDQAAVDAMRHMLSTIDVDGLDANQTYQFTLFAWDPGDSVDRDREWTVTGGTGVPTSNTLNWGTTALVDNHTFAMNFDITTDGSGAFQLTDTGALQGSAINGFILEQIPEPSAAVLAALAAIGFRARRRRS